MIKRDIETRIQEIGNEIAAPHNDVAALERKKSRLQAERDKLEALLEDGDYEQDEWFLREGVDPR